jgi:putative addiction module component (TIGR02574 family)
MNLSATLDEIKKLDVNERLDLVQAIWDSIEEESVPADLTDGQKADLSRRMAELRDNPADVLTFDELMARVRGQK